MVDGSTMLLIKHPTLALWIPPGGHVESGEDPPAAAIRETLEETGFAGALHPWHAAHRCPIDIDTHMIPENTLKQEPRHLHHDFRYLLVSSGGSFDQKEKNISLSWKPWAEILQPTLLRLIGKLQNRSLGVSV